MAPGTPPSDQERIAALEAELEAMRATVSWRLTAPLRSVRRRARVHPGEPVVAEPAPPSGPDLEAASAGLARRVGAVAAIFHDGVVGSSGPPAGPGALADVLERAGASDGEAAWLALVAATGVYPSPSTLDAARRVVRRDGVGAVVALAEQAFADELERLGTLPDIEVLTGRVLVDISQTTGQDLHSGIQRVARECAGRWLADHDDSVLVHFDEAASRLVRLSDDERARAIEWQQHLHTSGSHITRRDPEHATGATLVPWGCRHLIPEFVESRARVDAYVALREAGVTTAVGMVGYDLIPITASELTFVGITQSFGHYLSLLKRADVVAAISRSSGDELRSFLDGVRDQGLAPPRVVDRTLPSGGLDVGPDDLGAARESFGVGDRPLVLAVGSHEPRKNHLTILEAAERAWRAGMSFDLLFVGAFSWGAEEFAAEVGRLAALGRPVRSRERVAERELWALYRLATMTVFVSLVEGFGLPIAESLRCGTPVVTSNYGSMAEIGAGGGALLVDPRDPAAVGDAICTILTDGAVAARLAGEARSRTWPTWPEYADAVWSDLVPPATPAG